MQIILNNEPIEVTLEQEKTIGEVYDSLADWMRDGGMYPISLKIDDTEVDLNTDSDWKPISLESIQTIRFEAGNYNDIRRTQLITIIDYLNLILQVAAKSRESKDVSKERSIALAEYEHIRMALPGILLMSNENFSSDFIKLDSAAVAFLDSPENPEVLQEFAARIEQLRIILLDRLNELSFPLREIQKSTVLLKNLIPSLEEAGIALQTGRDREAYNTVFRISEMAAKMVRLVNILQLESTQSELSQLTADIQKMSELISEISESIRNDDSVMLADLLEYDLQEQLSDIVQRIEGLNLEAK